MNSEVTFSPVKSPEEVARVAELADIIWREHYIPIIGRAQVDYMLEHFQSSKAIGNQLTEGIFYFLIQREDLDLGYLAFEKRAASLFLSKIYLLESKKRHGTWKDGDGFCGKFSPGHGMY